MDKQKRRLAEIEAEQWAEAAKRYDLGDRCALLRLVVERKKARARHQETTNADE